MSEQDQAEVRLLLAIEHIEKLVKEHEAWRRNIAVRHKQELLDGVKDLEQKRTKRLNELKKALGGKVGDDIMNEVIERANKLTKETDGLSFAGGTV